jgi:armadillo repeat-containing protein 8
MHSLTWIEDNGDRADARQRARELRSLGIESLVRGMHNDTDQDVRERVRTVMRQMDGL